TDHRSRATSYVRDRATWTPRARCTTSCTSFAAKRCWASIPWPAAGEATTARRPDRGRRCAMSHGRTSVHAVELLIDAIESPVHLGRQAVEPQVHVALESL